MTPLKQKRKVCLVLDEIMPFTRGGIGAFARNMIVSYGDAFDITFLFSGSSAPALDDWNKLYPNVKLISVSDFHKSAENDVEWEELHLRHAFMVKSLKIYRALAALSGEGVEFDIIEFIDWGGPAFYPIQYKLSGLWQTDALLVVRIHCTESVLRTQEFRAPDQGHGLIYDIERKALADADTVIASLGPIADYYRTLYGFDDAWRSRVIVQAPKVCVEVEASTSIRASEQTNIVFSSKLQEIKRPKLFLSGALEFMSRNRAFSGDIVIAAFKAAETSINSVLDNLPAKYADRVKIFPDLAADQRQSLISNSIVVFPNIFEAFCFAAYEASLSGAIVVLNSENPAFDVNTPWIDRVNCFKFDGTASALADVLEYIYSGQAPLLFPVRLETTELPYWYNVDLPDLFEHKSSQELRNPTITIYILHRNQPNGLLRTLSSLRLECIDLKVVILDDGSTHSDALLALDQIQHKWGHDITVRKSTFRVGWGALLNGERSACDSDYIMIVPSGTTFTIGAIGAFVEALTRQPGYDVLLPTSSLMNNSSAHLPIYTFHPLGEALASGGGQNTYCAHVFISKQSVFVRHRFSEEMPNNFEWEYLRRLALSHCRMLIWPLADVIYEDEYVSAFETHLLADLSYNADLVQKIYTSSRIYGLPLDLTDQTQASPQSHDQSVSPSIMEVTAGPGLNSRDAQELELRRKFGRARSEPQSSIKKVLKLIQSKRFVVRNHVDRLDPSANRDGASVVIRGSQLAIEGWAFGVKAKSLVPANISLLKAGVEFPAQALTRHARYDVALVHDIPEDIEVGYTAHFDTNSLENGSYELVLAFDVSREKRGRYFKVRSIIVEEGC